MVVLIQLMALALAVLSLPTLLLAGGAAAGRGWPVLFLIPLISGGSFLVFWGLVQPRPWGRMAAIAFSGLLSLAALLVVGILATVGSTGSVLFASVVFAVLTWFTVALSRSELVRNFVMDTHDSDAI
jgi:hypothetical protein